MVVFTGRDKQEEGERSWPPTPLCLERKSKTDAAHFSQLIISHQREKGAARASVVQKAGKSHTSIEERSKKRSVPNDFLTRTDQRAKG